MLQNVCPRCDGDTLGRDFGKWFCFSCDHRFDTLKTIEFEELGNNRYRKIQTKLVSSIKPKKWRSRIDNSGLNHWYASIMKDVDDYLRT